MRIGDRVAVWTVMPLPDRTDTHDDDPGDAVAVLEDVEVIAVG